MIIHTKAMIIKNNNLKFLDENQETDIVLNVRDRIMNYFIKRKRKTTKNIERDLNIKPRTTRKAVKILETKGFIKRIDTKIINKKIGKSIFWELIKSYKIKRIVPKGEICIFYKTYHRKNSNKTHYFFIKKILLLNENSISAIGFFEAEGSKTRIKSTEVVNSELELIRLFINFLDLFKIQKEYLSFRIIFNKKILLKKEVIQKDLEEKSKIFWNKLIGNVKYNKFNYTGNLIGNLRENPTMNGSLNISYNNTIFRIFLFELIKEVKENLKERKDIIAYLRGFFAGEAYVGKKDREIQIASIKIDELNLVKNILEKLNVSSSISKKTSTAPPRLIITNLKSFLILESINIFKFHPIKKKNLITKILNYQSLDQNLRNKLKRKLT